MKKILVLLIMMFILSGCTVKENITIKKDLTVIEETDMSESKDFFNKRYKTLPINVVKEILYSQDRNKTLEENGYNYDIISNTEYPFVRTSKSFSSISDFLDNTIYKNQFFKSATTKENNNLITIKVEDFIYREEQDIEYYYVDNLYINITLPFVVTNNNASKYDAKTNTYTWVFDEKTNNKEISITFDKTRMYIYNLYIYIGIGIFAIIIGIGIYFVLKVIRKNKMINQI